MEMKEQAASCETAMVPSREMLAQLNELQWWSITPQAARSLTAREPIHHYFQSFIGEKKDPKNASADLRGTPVLA